MTGWPLIQPDSLEDRLLGWRRVKDMTGLSRSTAWRLQQTGDFPAPIRITTNRVAWKESDLLAWKAAKLNNTGSKAKWTLRPARIPRLPGMAHAPAIRIQAVDPPSPVIQASLDLRSAVSPGKPSRSNRKQTKINPNQIDFGF